jgi:adenosylcobinamide-phosphate synthase
VFVPTYRARAVGIALGYLADLLLADPRRGHPVALFGRGASRLERLTYSDSRMAGVAHVGALIGGLAVAGAVAERVAKRHGTSWTSACGTSACTAAATYVALGGTSLARVGADMAALLEQGDVAAARALLPALCGRDPESLDAAGLARAALESVAENTSDAAVAPLWWGAVGGVAGLLTYRGINTLDAMIGHRSPRYSRFGWAAARLDDVMNYLPARITGLLVAACAPIVGGSAGRSLTVWRSDAARHPSPNAGVAEAAFAGALDVGLGGPTQYAHGLEIRPALGAGPPPGVDDLRRSVVLSQAVTAFATVVAVTVSVVGRTGRRASPR